MINNCTLCSGVKPVFVRAYIRRRYGRIENVSQHCRSLPYQNRLR